MPQSLKDGLPASVAALNQHVQALDRDVSGLRQSLDNTASRFEASVASLNSRFEGAINLMTQKLESRGQNTLPNLVSIFAVVVAVAFGLWGAGIQPLSSRVDQFRFDANQRDERQQHEIDDITTELKRRSELFVTEKELSEFKARVKSEHEALRWRLDR